LPEIKLTPDEMRYIALFQDVTGAVVKDCIVDNDENRIIFLVRPGDMGLAIGKNGINIKRIRKIIGKNIEVVEFSNKLEELAKNALAPARVRSVKIVSRHDGRKVVYVNVDPRDKGIAIGKAGRNVARARLILKRYFDIDSVFVI